MTPRVFSIFFAMVALTSIAVADNGQYFNLTFANGIQYQYNIMPAQCDPVTYAYRLETIITSGSISMDSSQTIAVCTQEADVFTTDGDYKGFIFGLNCNSASE